jgi:hypothetical protein
VGSETTRIRALGKDGELMEGKVGVDDLMLLGSKYLTIVQAGVSVVIVVFIMFVLYALLGTWSLHHHKGQEVNSSSTQETHSPRTRFQERWWLSKMANCSRWGARLDTSVINGRYFSRGRIAPKEHVIVNTRSDNSAARAFVTRSINSGAYYDTRSHH